MTTWYRQLDSGAVWRFGSLLLSIFICLALILLIGPMAQGAPDIQVGAIFDHAGGINTYGIQQSKALHLAGDNINKKGGLLGRKLKIIEWDAQSELSKYTQYANTLILRDRISVLFAGLTSASREVVRPIIRKHKMLYFYSCHYEGGACDKHTFVTGVSASQQMRVLIPWAIKKYGPKIYIVGPDYNFGTISAIWVHHYAKQYGVFGPKPRNFRQYSLNPYNPGV